MGLVKVKQEYVNVFLNYTLNCSNKLKNKEITHFLYGPECHSSCSMCVRVWMLRQGRRSTPQGLFLSLINTHPRSMNQTLILSVCHPHRSLSLALTPGWLIAARSFHPLCGYCFSEHYLVCKSNKEVAKVCLDAVESTLLLICTPAKCCRSCGFVE